jgi:hypothetical protein
MKKIDLPITRRFATRVVDMQEACKELASGKITKIPLGTIDFGVSGKELDQARINGGIVIWSAICLEEKLESVITRLVFSSSGDTQEHKGRLFFSNRIIKDDHFSYAAKKGLAIDIVNSESLLEGREKDELSKALKEVMDFRNAFAHGDIMYEADKGCVLSYWKAGSKRDVLSEEYWEKLESSFKRAHALIDQVLTNQRPPTGFDISER